MNENPHIEHRQRLKERAIKNGLKSFDDITLLELILGYSIPRKDTRPLASLLLERFGSLYGILNAPVSDLESVSGISRHTALMFKSILEMSTRLEPGSEEASFEDEKTAGPFLVTCYSGEKHEKVLLLTLTPGGQLINVYTVQTGSLNTASFSMRRITELALKDDADRVVIAHNHPCGPLIPSDADLNTTKNIQRSLASNGIKLCQHYLISGDSYICIIDENI